MALQTCLGLCVPHGPSAQVSGGYVILGSSGVRSLAPRPNPENQGLHFVRPLLFDLSGMGEPTRSLLYRQHNSPGHWGAQTSSP
jgi:hypothetical protein